MNPLRNLIPSLLLTLPLSCALAGGTLSDEIHELQQGWAEVTYHAIGADRKDAGYRALEAEAVRVESAFPDRAEPKIWHGIILSTHAGVSGSLSALKKVKLAKTLFEQAIAIDETALDGSAHTSLGSLYYQVPRWPLGFGDDEKAEQHLLRALTINPQGIDANYFYADYLGKAGHYPQARQVLEAALAAPARSNRALADAGRRQEIRVLMDEVRKQLAVDGSAID